MRATRPLARRTTPSSHGSPEHLSARARAARGATVVRPTFAVGERLITGPRDGVIEAVVVVTGRARARAVAVRLEGLDRR